MTVNVATRFAPDGDWKAEESRACAVAAGRVFREDLLRHSLAEEIQSGICQDLALAKIKLSMLRTRQSAALNEALKCIEQLVVSAELSLRLITQQISPPALHDLGLVPALHWLCEDLQKQYGLSVLLSGDDSPAISDGPVRVLMFHAVRELLVNVARHSSVRLATLHIQRSSGSIEIVVQDLGSGFDLDVLRHHGDGLFAMRQQMHYIGGTIEINSSVGVGTCVTLTAPVDSAM